MLASRLLNSFQKHLDKPALWIAGTIYSYRELQDEVGDVGAIRKKQGRTDIGRRICG